MLLAAARCLHAPAARAQTAAGIEQTFAGSLTAMPTENLGVSGAFYVPVYSSVSMSQGKLRADFSVTLSIHNASETRPLVLRRIAYFDTSGQNGGKLPQGADGAETVRDRRGLRPHHRRPRRNRRQFRGGLGATGEIAEPVVEALMVGGVGSGHYAFTTQGRPVKLVGKN